MAITVNKKHMTVRLYRDGGFIVKKFDFNNEDDYERAYKEAREFELNLELVSDKSNTGYRYISLIHRSDGMVLLKGTIIRDGLKYCKCRTINDVSDIDRYLPMVVKYVWDKISDDINMDIDATEAKKTYVGYKI